MPPEEMPPFARVAATDRWGEAAHAVLGHYFAVFLVNEAGSRSGEVLALHDMRVASRRLRVALRVFRDALPKARAASFGRGFRRIGRALGAVRDGDVHLARLDSGSASMSLPLMLDIGAYRADIERRHNRARREMVRILDSRRHTKFIARFQAFLAAGPLLRDSAPRADLPVFAIFPKLFERRLRTFLKHGGKLNPDSSDKQLHRLRIECKKVRYLSEFFRTVYAGKPMLRCHRRLVALQEELGQLQDSVTGREKLHRFLLSAKGAGAEHEGLCLALGFLVDRTLRDAAAARRTFFKEWRRFDNPRHLCAVLAEIKQIGAV
jgi:CHAD domain-containing protein